MARGERVVVLALTERDGTWDPGVVTLEATPVAAGYRLTGRKMYVLDADLADELLVVARDGDSGRLLVVAVPAGAAGMKVEEMRGWNAQPFFAVTFDRVAVGQDAVVIAPGNADRAIQEASDEATIVLCAYMVGGAERVYEIALRYAHSRRQFGQPIAKFQRVQDHLIDMRGAIDKARYATLDAVESFEKGDPTAVRAISLAKALASEGFYEACDHAHHVHAGIGSDKNYGLYLYTKACHTYMHFLGGPAQHEARIAEALGF
jgi:alkylation response protein AidB-like acyl-CoA dehydrogenase